LTSKPKVGISLYSYGWDIKTGKMTVKDAIDNAASLNVDGVELVDKQHIPNYPHASVYDLIELRDYIESYGLKVSCYSTYIDDLMRTDQRATPEECTKMLLDDIAEAKVLGTKIIRPAMAQVNIKWLPLVKTVMTNVLPTLKKNDIKQALEIHAPLPPKAILEFVKGMNDDYIGLCPDFSAWQMNKQPGMTDLSDKSIAETVASFSEMNPIELLEECMPYTIHVHAKAHAFKDGEEVTIPYDKLIPIISKSGYSGYISTEFEGWMMDEVDSREIAKTHVELVRRYL